MTALKLRFFISYVIYLLLSLTFVLIQSSGIATLQIGYASAVLILPLTVYAGYYFGEYFGAVFGLIVGAVTDAFASTLCFNTVILTVCGFTAGLLVTRLFNRNLSAAVVMNSVGGFAYFFLKWLVLYAFRDPAAGFILTRFSLTSFIYTAVLGILLYFLLNLILGKLPVRPSKR